MIKYLQQAASYSQYTYSRYKAEPARHASYKAVPGSMAPSSSFSSVLAEWGKASTSPSQERSPEVTQPQPNSLLTQCCWKTATSLEVQTCCVVMYSMPSQVLGPSLCQLVKWKHTEGPLLKSLLIYAYPPIGVKHQPGHTPHKKYAPLLIISDWWNWGRGWGLTKNRYRNEQGPPLCTPTTKQHSKYVYHLPQSTGHSRMSLAGEHKSQWPCNWPTETAVWASLHQLWKGGGGGVEGSTLGMPSPALMAKGCLSLVSQSIQQPALIVPQHTSSLARLDCYGPLHDAYPGTYINGTLHRHTAQGFGN